MLARLVSALAQDGLSGQALAAHAGFDAPLALAIFRCARGDGQQNLPAGQQLADRSEEHTSELQSR